jgi:hypothetical protein
VVERVVCESNEDWEAVSINVFDDVISHTYGLGLTGEEYTEDLLRRETLRSM